MAFTYKILTQNGVDNTNIDGARAEYFAAGMRDGIIKGSLNECAFTVIPSNGINLDTGVLLVAGHPIVITEGRSWTFTSRPSNSERRAVIAEITVDNNRSVAFRVFEQLASIALVKNNMYEHENGSGTYQVEIGRFTLTTSGLVEDVVRTLDLITGGSSGMGEHFVAGNITTTMLEAGMNANVTAEDIYDANGDYKQTNFSFELPETAGTVITVNDVEQENIHFTSDPQTQLDNKVDEVAGKGLSENDYTTAEKNKLAGIAAEANKTIVDDTLSSSSENPVQNKVVKNALDAKADTNASNLTSSNLDNWNTTLSNKKAYFSNNLIPEVSTTSTSVKVTGITSKESQYVTLDNDELTIQKDGLYRILFSGNVTADNRTIILSLRKNGSVFDETDAWVGFGNYQTTVNSLCKLSEGDKISFYAYTTTGSATATIWRVKILLWEV